MRTRQVAVCWPALALLFSGWLAGGAAAQEPLPVVELKVGDRRYEGEALGWDGRELILLRRDGRVSRLPLRSLDPVRVLKKPFQPYSALEMEERLRSEFGNKYQVSRTAHFLVVHPAGGDRDWAQPFESIFVQLREWFRVRGWEPPSPRFPMVAVVLRTRAEFKRFLDLYHPDGRNLVGYYSPGSNRIITWDQRDASDPWSEGTNSGMTLVHEAVHQVAFNCGIHARYGGTPLWISEGLATMWEQEGFLQGRRETGLAERCHPVYLRVLRDSPGLKNSTDSLAALITADRIFQEDPETAYALAWALSFYLSQKRPAAYVRLLQQTGDPDGVRLPSSARRLSEFETALGESLPATAIRMERFLRELPGVTGG